MKKSFSILSIAIASLFASCSNQGNQSNSNSENNDSLKVQEVSVETPKAQGEVIEFNKLDVNSLKKSFVIRIDDEGYKDTLEMAFYLPNGKIVAYGCSNCEYDCETKFDFYSFNYKNDEVTQVVHISNFVDHPLMKISGEETIYQGEDLENLNTSSLVGAREFADAHMMYSRTFFLDYDLEKKWENPKTDDKGRILEAKYKSTDSYDPKAYKQYNIKINWEDSENSQIGNANLEVINHYDESQYAEEECPSHYVTDTVPEKCV